MAVELFRVSMRNIHLARRPTGVTILYAMDKQLPRPVATTPAAPKSDTSSPAESGTFGAELRRLRRQHGLSLAQLSRAVNYSRSWLSRVETGRCPPNLPLAKRCDSVLGANGSLAALVPAPRRRRRFSALPPPVGIFVGRDDMVATLTQALGRPGTVAIVSGMPGIGKTALAIHTALSLRTQFSDACLFADLRGYDSMRSPANTAEIAERLLAQLGISAGEMPADATDRAALYRHLLSGTRALVVLDNARDARQVAPFLLNGTAGAVIVTSRHHLTALDEAFSIRVEPLPASAAHLLFERVVGGALDPDLAATVVGHCGGLPLALRIVAARCRGGDVHVVKDIAHNLSDLHARLDEFDDGERSARASFDLSFEHLLDADQRLFLLLGVHPTGSFDSAAAAALDGSPMSTMGRRLRRLHDVGLLTRDLDSRFRLHDLVRDYAIGRRGDVPAADTREALDRLVCHYTAMAEAADHHVTPHRHRLDAASTPAPSFRDYATALHWFEIEVEAAAALCLVASAAGLHDGCWRLAYALRGYLFLSKRWETWVRTHEAAIAAARRLGLAWAEAVSCNNLGMALIELRELDRADTMFRTADALFAAIGDDRGCADVKANRGWVLQERGDHHSAIALFAQALAHYRHTGANRSAAITVRGIALSETAVGDVFAAVAHLGEAQVAFADLKLPLDATMTWNALAEAHLATGRLNDAEQCARQAMVGARSCGSDYEQARAYHALGRVARGKGDIDLARRLWTVALDMFHNLRAQAADSVRRRLEELAPEDHAPIDP